MTRFQVVVLCVTLLGGLFLAQQAVAEEIIGSVKVAQGEATIQRGEQTIDAAPGVRLFPGDTLQTGADGRIGVIFRDDTLLSLGPGSELVIEDFLFSPADNHLSMILRMLHGLAAYVSGKIAKLAPEAVKIETPVGTVGVRGTRMLIRIED